jgi:hypothetical protein
MTCADVTVFAVYVSDCVNEVGSVAAVFSTREKATEHALACVELEKEENAQTHRRSTADGYPAGAPDKWEEARPGIWSNGTHVVYVTEHLLDDSATIAKLADDTRRAREP